MAMNTSPTPDNEQNNNDNQNGLLETNNKDIIFGFLGCSFLGTIALTAPFISMPFKSPLPYMATPRHKVISALNYIAKQKQKQSHHHPQHQQQQTIPLGNKIRQYDYNHETNIKTELLKNPRLQFYDLGSGDGESVLAASKLGWNAVGIEMNSTLFLISSFRRLFLILRNRIIPSHHHPKEEVEKMVDQQHHDHTTTTTTTTLYSHDIQKNSKFIWGNMFHHSINDADAVMIFGVKPLMPKIAKKISTECQPGTYIMSYRFHVPLLNPDPDHHDIDQKNVIEDHVLHAIKVYDKEDMRIYFMNKMDTNDKDIDKFNSNPKV